MDKNGTGLCTVNTTSHNKIDDVNNLNGEVGAIMK
jgi:hypothetical protein